MNKLVFAFISALSLQASALYQPPDIWKADIVDKAQRTLLYNYTRSVTKSGNQSTVKREFQSPEGQMAAVETVIYEGDKVVKMELDQKQTGEKGFFEVKDKKINFSYEKDGKTKTDHEDYEANTVSTDEVGPYLQKNWEALVKKEETLSIRFPVITRQETVGFKFFKDREDEKNVYIKMKPSSIVIAALVNPLIFKLEKEGEHRILEVDGRVTPKKKVDNSWKDLDALLVLKY